METILLLQCLLLKITVYLLQKNTIVLVLLAILQFDCMHLFSVMVAHPKNLLFKAPKLRADYQVSYESNNS